MQYIGVDIGKKLNMACKIIEGFDLLEFTNDEKGIDAFLSWIKSPHPSRIVVEATGGYHYPLVWRLLEMNYEVRVINPLLAKRKRIVSLRKLKSDAHDAHVLAELAREGKGTIWIPTREHFHLRMLARSYYRFSHTLVQEQLHEKRMKELWNYTGVQLPDWLAEDHLKTFRSFKRRLKKLLEQIDDPVVDRLSTIPGISRSRASMILAEVGCFDRFSTIKEFIAYCGLDPSIHQSGGKPQTYGRLSKRGSPVLRTALFHSAMASWQTYFRSLYDHHRARQRSYTETLVIIARKLARIVYSLARSNKVFSMHFP